jgi:hypothetical protein
METFLMIICIFGIFSADENSFLWFLGALATHVVFKYL